MDLKKLRDDAQKEMDNLKAAKLRLRGSKAYDDMIDTYDVMIRRIDQLRESKGDNYELNELEVQELRGYAERTEYSANAYLKTKDNLKKIKTNTKKRMDAAKGTKVFNEAFIEQLDARQDVLDNKVAPDIPTLSSSMTEVHSRMVKSDLNFRGSKAYGEAIKKYEKAQKNIKQLKEDMANPTNPKVISYAEIEEQMRVLEDAKLSIETYLSQKEDVIDAKSNTRKRIDAMRDGKNTIVDTMKRLQTIKNSMEERLEMNTKALYGETSITCDEMADAKQGVHFGSKEYDEAEKAFNKVNIDLDHLYLADTDETYTTTNLEPSERKAFQENLDDAEKKIDKYLARHRNDDKLDPKTKKRVDVMLKAKNNIIETKRRFDADTRERNANSAKIKDETLRQEENNISEEIQKAHLLAKRTGSQEFKNAQEKYNEVIASQANFDSEGGLKNHSKEEIQKQIKELRDAQEMNQKYLDLKKDIPEKKLKKNTKIRIQSIKKASDQLEKRIEKMEAHLDNLEKLDKDALKENHIQAQQRIKDIRSVARTSKGVDRTAYNASTDAVRTLDGYAQKKALSPAEKKGAKYAIAALILQSRITNSAGNQIRKNYPSNPKEYAKCIKQIAESPEFKQEFPDSRITPSALSKLSADPKEVTKVSKRVFSSIAKNNEKKKELEKSKELEKKKDLNKNKKKEIEKPKF